MRWTSNYWWRLSTRNVATCSKVHLLAVSFLVGLFWVTPSSASVCSEAIQGRIAWDYNGTNTWGAGNIARLCGDAEDSPEPAHCFDSVLHGRLPKTKSTTSSEWRWQDAVNLCKGTQNSVDTVACFREAVADGLPYGDGIKQCAGRQFDPRMPTPTPAPSGSEQVVTLQLRPADSNTRSAIRNASRPTSHSALKRIAATRLTNLSGWYDLLPRTTGGSTGSICRDACDEVDRCIAFVIDGEFGKSSGNREGGFCGLIFDRAAVRYDRAWVSDSRRYNTYAKGGSGISSSTEGLDMIGMRTVARMGVATRPRNNPSFPPVLWETRFPGSLTAKPLTQCARQCAGDGRCNQFVSKPTTGLCVGFLAEPANRSHLSTLEGFSSGTAYYGYMMRYDRITVHDRVQKQSVGSKQSVSSSQSDRRQFFGMFNPEIGLGLFSDGSIDTIRSSNNRYADDVVEESATMHTAVDDIWFGERPPVASRDTIDEGESELDAHDMGDFLNAEFTAGFLPFHSTVWKSKTETGTYHYAPRAYWFDWNVNSQRLGGAEFFNVVGAIGDGEDVRMQIRLSGAYTPSELDTFRKYVDAFVASRGLPAVHTFVRFPISGSPVADLTDGLTGLVVSDSIELFTTNMDGIGSPVDIVFNVSDVNAQGLLTSWMDPAQTIGGDLVFQSSRIGQDEIRIPVTLDPYHPGTYGNVEIADDRWVNKTPFPVRITRVKALDIKTDEAATYYWDVSGNAGLEPGGTANVRFDADFPEQLISRMDRVWVQYEIDHNCETCAQRLFGVGAVTGEARSVVEFVLPDSVASRYNAEEVVILFRSRHLRPGDDRVRNADRPIRLTPEETSKTSQPLYLGDDNQLGFGVASYSYRATLYTVDGGSLCIPWTEDGEQYIRLSNFSSDETDCE